MPGTLGATVQRTRLRLVPEGPGRCRLVDESGGRPEDRQSWELRYWHLLDFMVSVRLRRDDGHEETFHWTKWNTQPAIWFGLRRWLVWSGRRVGGIGERTM
jgi:hypothetical protein